MTFVCAMICNRDFGDFSNVVGDYISSCATDSYECTREPHTKVTLRTDTDLITLTLVKHFADGRLSQTNCCRKATRCCCLKSVSRPPKSKHRDCYLPQNGMLDEASLRHRTLDLMIFKLDNKCQSRGMNEDTSLYWFVLGFMEICHIL